MKIKRLLSFAFVAFMLALAVLVLMHGQAPAVPVEQAAQAEAAPSITLRPAKAAERSAAIASIQAQLKAFARDDYQTAVGYQSAALKRNFPSPDAFRAMMQHMYPEFAHYKSAQFGKAQADSTGQHVAIPVILIGQDGVTVHAVYMMVREGKTYRVEGVGGGATAAPMENNDGPEIPGQDV